VTEACSFCSAPSVREVNDVRLCPRCVGLAWRLLEPVDPDQPCVVCAESVAHVLDFWGLCGEHYVGACRAVHAEVRARRAPARVAAPTGDGGG
jgi:hypothetical protein